MDRQLASKFCREKLDEYGLKDWSIRLNASMNSYLGLCSHKDKCIILNSHHIDTNPEPEIRDTILHEIAHALVGPNHEHNPTWVTKAREIGVNNLSPCATIGLNPLIIDAIRSGATVEVEFEEKTIERTVTVEEKVHIPKYKVTRLQEKCPDCGKVAVEKFSIDAVNKNGEQVKLITLECFHIITKIIPKGTPFETMVSNDWKPEIKNCPHKWDKNQCVVCGEFKLFNFQITGAQFAEIGLATQKGVGIFDEMGLGKTIQALAMLRFHADKYTPTMVVTKSAIKFQWFKAAVTWLGPQFIGQIISTGRDYFMPGLKLYIIPYDLLRRFTPEKREQLYKLGIKMVILDEVQQIKNPDSSRTQNVRKLVSGSTDCKVFELSGTPWKNRGSEFFPALNLLDPQKFYSNQNFLDRWVEYYWDGNRRKMGGIRNIPKFKEYVSTLILRREYNEVMDEFPDVNRMKLSVQLDELTQTSYDDSESEFVKWYNDFVLSGEEEKALGGIEILAQMARMRHITGLAKIPATLSFVETFVEETNKKLVIFVHHKDVGQLLVNALKDTNKETNPDWYELAETLKEEGIPVYAYGSQHTGKPEGYDIQEAFNKTPRCIMVASTLACGEGLNLQTCADSLLHERQWNPQNEDQATPGRFKRIGQTSKVINVTLPEAEGTIDQDLDGIVEEKRRRFHAVHNKGEVPTWNEGQLARELAERILKRNKLKKSKSEVKTNITMAAKR